VLEVETRARSTTTGALSLLFLAALLVLMVMHACWLLFTGDAAYAAADLVLQLVSLVLFAVWSRSALGSFLNPPFMFISAIYFWHSTFLTGYYLSSGPMFQFTGDVFNYGEEYVPQAVALVSLSMAGAIVGSVAGYLIPLRRATTRRLQAERDVSPVAAWLFFGAILVISLAYLAEEGPKTFQNGYMFLYNEAPDTPIYRLWDATSYFGVLAILMVFQSAKSFKQYVIAGAMTMLLVFINLLFGTRSMPFIYALTLLVSIDRFVRRIPFLALVAIAVIASAASFVIDHTRGSGLGLQILDFQRTGLSIDLFNIFWNAGNSVKTILRTMEFAGQSGLWWGRSFFDALLSLVPTPVWTTLGLSWNFVRPSMWLVDNSNDLPVGVGLGYSLVAESYVNFGIIGFLIFIPIGWFLGRQFLKGERGRGHFGYLHAFNASVLLALHMRNDFQTYFRTIFWGIVIVEVLRSRILQRRAESPVLVGEPA